MTLIETMNQLNVLLATVARDLNKVHRGNKAASQRVRVGTIRLAKIGKRFREESVDAEKSGKFKKKPPTKKGKRKKKKR